MIVATALALFLRQNPLPPPTLPAGTSPEFAKLALAVEAKLVEGDTAGARELARSLPVREPRVIWKDDSNLPAGLKAERAKSFAMAVSSWSKASKNGFAPKETEDAPDVAVGFAEALPEGADGLPLAARTEPGTPFRATIGLMRGKPGTPIRKEDLTVQLAYVLGRYLGVPEAPFPGSAMHLDARPNLLPLMPQRPEAAVAAGNLELADRLRAGIAAGKPTGLVVPTVSLPKARLDLGEVRQGEPIRASLEIENVGAGPLDCRIEPDCSCFSPFPQRKIASQGRTTFPVVVNTQDYIGRQDKVLLLLSNDPERPQIEIPVSFSSRPAYRMFRPGGASVVVPAKGGAYDVFLFADPKLSFRPTEARWTGGVDGTVTMTEWSGALADPEMKEESRTRQGWRFRVRLSGDVPPGQWPGSLVVSTDSRVFSTLIYGMTAQKGIVADRVYLGDITEQTRASFLVGRPNAPFKVLGVDAGKAFKATWRDHRPGGWEYQIDLEYLGGAQKGDLAVPVRIRTDDPKQPVVETLITGNVR